LESFTSLEAYVFTVGNKIKYEDRVGLAVGVDVVGPADGANVVGGVGALVVGARVAEAVR
jgi:hypothetical protein